MDWLTWIALLALFVGIWHETNRFPATNESIFRIQERLDELEAENREMREKLERLDNENLNLSNELDKIKDPEYYRALEEGDGLALYNMDKAHGKI